MEVSEQGREDLAKLFVGVGVEVGVERAHFSKIIARHCSFLYLVDPWKAYRGYREHVSQSKLDGFYEEAKQRMANYPVKFIRKFSVDASKDFDDKSLDFVYIDANHSTENTTADIMAWWPKLKRNGILSGHDYVTKRGLESVFGVIPAVDKFVKENSLDLYIFKGDRSPSWMVFKP